MFQNCIAQQEKLKENKRNSPYDQRNKNENIDNMCDGLSLRTIKTQLDIHERLYKRYTCGELSRNNTFCRHLNHMAETRKNLLKQLERMDFGMFPQPTGH